MCGWPVSTEPGAAGAAGAAGAGGGAGSGGGPTYCSYHCFEGKIIPPGTECEGTADYVSCGSMSCVPKGQSCPGAAGGASGAGGVSGASGVSGAGGESGGGAGGSSGNSGGAGSPGGGGGSSGNQGGASGQAGSGGSSGNQGGSGPGGAGGEGGAAGSSGSGGEGGSSGAGGAACVPSTCADQGLECGPATDGCGAALDCGGCALPTKCAANGAAGKCEIPASCTNLCLQQVDCPGAAVTTVSGRVYAPNGVDPLPNVLVYVPNGPVAPFSATVACDRCSGGVSGAPLVRAATDAQGNFTLKNVPAGAAIPLVVQTGRWRRQVQIPLVTACQDTLLPASLTRLPKNKGEGDLPHIAVVTGAVDVVECVLRKIGVQDSEFTSSDKAGRVHLYVGDGKVNVPGAGQYSVGGANAGATTAGEASLVGSAASLEAYDLLLLPCKGAEKTRSSTELANLATYMNAGGRVLATHFSYVWLQPNPALSGVASWSVNQLSPADQSAQVDTSFPKGQALAGWLQAVGATQAPGQIPLQSIKRDYTGVLPPSRSWLSIGSPLQSVQFSFNTPVGAPADQQCGRGAFTDYHVENHGEVSAGSAYGLTFPAECDDKPMSAQEKLLEYSLFDLGSCVAPDAPACAPKTCADQGLGCGPAGDGCGGLLDCGSCPGGESCGGGGPGVCGAAASCAPKTCADQGKDCGPAGDGCGGLLDCGSCSAPQICGGGGKPGVCGGAAPL